MRNLAVKPIFGKAVLLFHGITLCFAVWLLVQSFSVGACGLLLIAVAPFFQAITGYDVMIVPHHKVRLPKTSFLVLLGLAIILLTVGKSSRTLWLGLINIAGFLLDTYWAKDGQV